MNRYNIQRQVGDGTYGCVLFAMNKETGEKVAIKKMKKKFYSWDECLNLREVKSLRKLNHANIIKLKEVIRENDQLFFVFEYMKENLYQMMKDRDKIFPESTVRNVIYQVLQGLAFMHKHGFFHRDMKPENLLCSGPDCVKVADFGLARETRSQPPYTDYVSTRWYRAPEVLLRATNYSSPIDIWAVGCIMAELYLLRPLFPGSSEIDQIFKICSILGTPTRDDWEEGFRLASSMRFRWPQCVTTNLKSLIPNASGQALQLMTDMMRWNPAKRPNSIQIIRHGYFQVGQNLGIQPRVTVPPSIERTQPQSYMPSAQAKVSKPLLPDTSSTSNVNKAAFVSSLHNNTSTNSPPSGAIIPASNVNSIVGATKPSRHHHGVVPQKPAEMDSFTVSVTKKPSGRRRWGGLSETWDDFDDLDLGMSITKTKKVPPIHRRDSLTQIENKKEKDKDMFDDDLFGSPAKRRPSRTLPAARINSGRSSASSAKQHYMGKARYLPGISVRNSAAKENMSPNSGFGLGTSKPSIGLNINRGNLGIGVANPNYVPSFMGSASKSNYQNMGWKRAQPAPMSINNPSSNRQVPVHGRTDWTAKYLKS